MNCLRERNPFSARTCLLGWSFVLSVAISGGEAGQSSPSPVLDDLTSWRGQQLRDAREEALAQKMAGQTGAHQKVVPVGEGRFVETVLEGSDRVFVVLAQTPGNPHNQVPPPDRDVDPFTTWEADYNRGYYQDLVFTQLRRYLEAQSGGRYTISGYVTDWVDTNFFSGGFSFDNKIGLAPAAISAWREQQIIAGASVQDVDAFLASFDVKDPFDVDQDGVFDEPDGELDKVILVESGDGSNFPLAGAFATFGGSHEDNAPLPPASYPIAGTSLAVGALVWTPESRPIGTIAHEYGHLLGLPDQYAGFYLVGSRVGYWSLMSQGVTFGSRPGLSGLPSMSAWDKLQLGWLDYAVTAAGERGAFTLAAAGSGARTRTPQALLVNLPDNILTTVTPTQPIAPPAGSAFWWADPGRGSSASMVTTIHVPAASPTLSMKLWWALVPDVDFGYVEVSNDNGQTWTALTAPGVTTTDDWYGLNSGNGFTAYSDPNAVGIALAASFDLGAYAGTDVLLRIRVTKNTASAEYIAALETWAASEGMTLDDWLMGLTVDQYLDAVYWETGLVVDDITVGGWTDGAEAGTAGWTLDGVSIRATVTTSSAMPHYYLAEYRNHAGTDAVLADSLSYGRFNSGQQGFDTSRYGYEPGLLVWYRNRHIPVGPHQLGLMAIDAHPVAELLGEPMHNIFQLRDSAFSLQPTREVTLTYDLFDVPYSFTFPSLPAEPVFDDSRDYSSPYSGIGVSVPQTGTRIRVVNTSMQGAFMHVVVGK